MDQHFEKEFRPHLGRSVKMVPISGDSNEKDFFGCVVRDSNLVICTAQILENALKNTEESKHVELTGNNCDPDIQRELSRKKRREPSEILLGSEIMFTRQKEICIHIECWNHGM